MAGDGCPTDAAHCVRSLNEAAATVARFRPTMVPVVCPFDLDDDGIVGVQDLVLVILNWGPCPPDPDACTGDTNRDGIVDVTDLTDVILHWSLA